MALDLPLARDLVPRLRADRDGSAMRLTAWELWLARVDCWLADLRAYEADNDEFRAALARSGKDDR
jgi:hypothetical protein